MNEKHARYIVTGVAIAFGSTVLAHGALQMNGPREVSVPVPGPTVTEKEVREHKIPVPGPTVTKKVEVTKTVRPKVPQKTTRNNERKWKAPAPKKTVPPAVPQGGARAAARNIFGSQYSCIDALITRESGWRVNATNPSSGAYGLPQALPGSKMASHGADWRTNPVTQLRWMKSYVDSRYGGACAALNFQKRNNWY